MILAQLMRKPILPKLSHERSVRFLSRVAKKYDMVESNDALKEAMGYIMGMGFAFRAKGRLRPESFMQTVL